MPFSTTKFAVLKLFVKEPGKWRVSIEFVWPITESVKLTKSIESIESPKRTLNMLIADDRL